MTRIAQGLPIFVNMTGFWICVEIQLWKGSENSRIPIYQFSVIMEGF